MAVGMFLSPPPFFSLSWTTTTTATNNNKKESSIEKIHEASYILFTTIFFKISKVGYRHFFLLSLLHIHEIVKFTFIFLVLIFKITYFFFFFLHCWKSQKIGRGRKGHPEAYLAQCLSESQFWIQLLEEPLFQSPNVFLCNSAINHGSLFTGHIIYDENFNIVSRNEA